MQQTRVNLDWLRGLAALVVCALHCREITWIGLRKFHSVRDAQGPIDYLLAYLCAPIVWGSIGVTVFFVLSGYVIHASTAARLVDDPDWKLDVESFYKRRIVRIYPVLVGALALTFALDTLSALLAPEHDKLQPMSLWMLIGNLLSLQSTVVDPFGSNGPLWTLAIEIQFYALYPLLLLVRRRLSAEKILMGSAVLAILSYVYLEGPKREWFTSYYCFWILGFYAAELRSRGFVRRPRVSLDVAATLLTIAGCGVFFKSLYYGQFLWAIGFFCYLLNLLAKPAREGIAIQALTAIGVFSYTLYATHFPIIVFLHSAASGGMKSTSMAAVLLFVAATTGIAYLVFRVFEKPSLAWLAGRHAPRGARSADVRLG